MTKNINKNQSSISNAKIKDSKKQQPSTIKTDKIINQQQQQQQHQNHQRKNFRSLEEAFRYFNFTELETLIYNLRISFPDSHLVWLKGVS